MCFLDWVGYFYLVGLKLVFEFSKEGSNMYRVVNCFCSGYMVMIAVSKDLYFFVGGK